MTGRLFAIGDLHGRLPEFEQMLQLWNFDPTKDTLILIGDLVDYGMYSAQLIQYLIKMGDCIIPIRGNHDAVLQIWAQGSGHLYNWSHGGGGTLTSYGYFLEQDYDFASNMMHRGEFPSHHLGFLRSMRDYFIIEDTLYCHAGINLELSLEYQDDEFYNNRSFYKLAKKGLVNLDGYQEFNRIVVGHTITHDKKPFISREAINLDTGAKTDGFLTMMDMRTLEYKQIKTQ